MDFFQICTKESRGVTEVYPDFTIGRSKDLRVRGQSFYAIWDEEQGLWSTDEYDVQRLVDAEVLEYTEKLKASGVQCSPKTLRSSSNGIWFQFRKYMKNVSDNSHQLDAKLTFMNTDVKKSDHVSRRLPYNLAPGDYSAWDELIGHLYDPIERAKIEWAIGAVISGDSKTIEKFLVFYGPGGTGKSTIMKIIQKLFTGYIATFEAKALVGNNNAFALEAFRTNPLVAIQHDGDLSKIEDNSTLNSVVGHDTMKINEKFKPGYDSVINAFLFMGTNKPVTITDAKSGLIRRLIDVNPSLRKFEFDHYNSLMDRIEFELGAIAHHCLTTYKKMGKSHYNKYEPTSMMLKTDVFFNFIEDHFDIFKEQDGTTLAQAWALYKTFAEESELKYSLVRYKFREELKNYFSEFHDRTTINGENARSVYKGFTANLFKAPVSEDKPHVRTLMMDSTESVIDDMYAGLPAQYGNSDENPKLYWDGSERVNKSGELFTPKPSQVVSTVLGDLDTSKLHFVKVPEHHIVIDFDLKVDGKKSLEANLEAASSWPATYAELSKSGDGVHLHYIYDGDSSLLANEYAEDIEVKVYAGNSSLRRRLTKCNNVPVATINSGLPFKEKKPMLQSSTLKSEKSLRDMINRNLRKEIHPGTKPSIDFIEHLLRESKRDGLVFDVSDMKPKIMAFAVNSTNKAPECLKAVVRMEFVSEGAPEDLSDVKIPVKDERVVFFDCEVYPNLFVVCWKYHGEGTTVVRMINPSPADIERLFELKLVGFNNRSYDNHILWARFMGASNEELYKLSQKIIVEKEDSAKFGEAWNVSYADVYDYSVDKKGLKKWEIELGIPHVEMDIPWDKPVEQKDIQRVVDYCCNDVLALEAVFEHCKQDFVARQILADMSGLPVNSSTRQHAIRIMFGNEREPQKKFVYTDLSGMFPGYTFDEYSKTEKSKYKGEVVGEGGYVYAEPGMYKNVALLDVASMHPTSIEELNLFGPYTEKFTKIKAARVAIKHGDFEKANELIPGIQVDADSAKALSNALKLVINSIYGYTSAKFMNPFRDKRNKDNIVAKRGALFMIDLKNAVQERGFTVAHIKTDSIKIPDATPEIIDFVFQFGAKYGYDFEHEATYEKMCLVNDAVYIAKTDDKWTATGAQFKHPYVFKTLFTHEPISFRDLCETKMVKEGAMHLRFPKGDVEIKPGKDELAGDTHVGRSGSFVPINPDQDMFTGGQLLRIKDDKEYAVTGTKGFVWAESEMIRGLQNGAIERLVFERLEDAVQGTGSIADVVDMAYYNSLAEAAYQALAKFGDADEFIDGKSFQDTMRDAVKYAKENAK